MLAQIFKMLALICLIFQYLFLTLQQLAGYICRHNMWPHMSTYYAHIARHIFSSSETYTYPTYYADMSYILMPTMSGLTKGHIGHKYVQYVPIASAPPGSPLIMNAVIWFGSMSRNYLLE